ncbi:MAG: DNA cytosine methyltransferase [Gemmatimonadaceae bacterium]|nr:DNA cytosine methyltransferase [Gemmatimonadaceae bacterium]
MIGGDELVIDSFAGGGGASLGIEMAIGRSPDIAINHDHEAIALHKANHPHTRHYREDVWKVDPREATGGQPVGLMWLSPDCKHFSKAKGGKPVSPRVRGLAWVAVRWAVAVRPRVIVLENVEEFQTWGPLGSDDRPCPKRRGLTFKRFTGRLRNLGYDVQWRELRACDYGAPTIRKRLFLIARCDGQPIVWPKPTHAKDGRGGLLPWRIAAECIDWSIPCPSIFERTRPLAVATQRRIAAGLRRYVLESPRPFIVQGQNASSGDAPLSIDAPMRTVTAHPKGGGFALVAPTLVVNTTDHPGSAANDPLRTVTTGGHHALVAAFLAKHQSERGNEVQAASLFDPVPTVKARDSNALVTAHIVKMRGDNIGHGAGEPLHTVSAGGTHFAEVRAFLTAYYGNEKDGGDLFDPMRTVTSKERFGLVTVEGHDYAIRDIGMRMLAPRELYRAQGFPDSYRIDVLFNGKPMTKTAQVRMCGNSVVPAVAAAIVAANVGTLTQERAA